MGPKTFVLLVAALNLAAGASFGFALGRSSVERLALHRDDPASSDPEVDLARLADVLALPPEKDAKVRAMLASFRPRADAVMKDVRPKLQALHEAFLGELEEELTPAQVSQLVEEFHRRVMKARLERRD